MRVGKRATVVEAKKTRTCVVRLEKVSSSPSPPPPPRTTRGNTTTVSVSRSTAQQQQHQQQQHQQQQQQHQNDTKMLRGPLKKRPITEAALVVTPKAKLKAALQKAEREREMLEEIETPPTIAAGRSRRAIKPNPKYTSEDMVTPKLIKNVAVLGSSGDKKGDKHRRTSTSSSEDFYNKASSDEENADESQSAEDLADDDEMDRAYQEELKNTDSDFSEVEPEVPVVPKRGRGRPRKDQSASGIDATAARSAASASKAPQSQLQQLRKTYATSVNRVSLAGTKRKNEMSAEDVDTSEPNVTSKRFKLQSGGIKYTPVGKGGVEGAGGATPKTPIGQRGSTTHTLNGSKLISIQSAPGIGAHENRKYLLERSLTKAVNAKASLSAQQQQQQQQQQKSGMLLNRTPGGRIVVVGKQRSASPATGKAKNAINEQSVDPTSGKQKESGTATGTTEETDGMHTFTIVNINDIINKKGDALISKSVGGNKSSPNDNVKVQKLSVENNDVSAGGGGGGGGVGGMGAVSADGRSNRRKAGHTTILSEKVDTERLKNPLPRTPFPPKKPVGQATILNLAMLNKKAQAAENSSPVVQQILRRGKNATEIIEKPAPRILNSVVAKRTQPVKPMITNLEDSADESFQLSLDEDEEMEGDADGDDVDNGAARITTDKSSVSNKARKLVSSTPIVGIKKQSAASATVGAVVSPTAAAAASATKENSLAATNRLPAKTPIQSRKTTTPEKTVITRQGDKIIKKITCFENWYVLNIPEDSPARMVRNSLDIPLIQLANAATSIKLPSDAWSSKVTLYTIPPSMQSKSEELTLYTGDLAEHNIKEEDRAKQQPTCVMFRRAIADRNKTRLPFDRAVIFKNKTFFTNIEGKNIKLEAAPTAISTEHEVEILLEIIDSLTLQSSLVEQATTVH